MLLPPGCPWGYLTGKLSLSPLQAWEQFGFVMSPEAQGLIFRTYTLLDDIGQPRKQTIVSNYVPPANPQTIPQQVRRMKFAGGVATWHALDQHIKETWNDRAQKSHLILSGFNLFLSMYMRDLL